MAYNPGALEAALAAAVGETPDLVAELRAAFFDSADAHVVALQSVSTSEEWLAKLRRLRSLAASFGATRLMDAAHAAESAAPGDKLTVARIERTMAALRRTI